MIIVIADDITGAAEIAGIGLRFNMRVKLIMNSEHIPADCDLLVYATDTRSMPEEEAIELSNRLANKLLTTGHRKLFKKTDSALRGHITAELRPFTTSKIFSHILCIPQNPSRGRIIREGVYYINETPLHETSFKDDPEFPATTSRVADLLPEKEEDFYIADASSEEDIKKHTARLDAQTLPAGGADFFKAYLEANGYTHQKEPAPFQGLGSREALIVCGSTVKHTLTDFRYIWEKGLTICSMPLSVFEGETPEEWIKELKKKYRKEHSLLLTIGHAPKTGKAFAVRLKETFSQVVLALLSTQVPDELIIEGGATAYSILNTLQCHEFTVEEEIDPGVIRLTCKQPVQLSVIMKPGSYPWGKAFI